jgi:hypothetical protein
MTRPCNVWGGLRKIVRNWKTAMWAGRALVGKAARSLVTQIVKMKIIDLADTGEERLFHRIVHCKDLQRTPAEFSNSFDGSTVLNEMATWRCKPG